MCKPQIHSIKQISYLNDFHCAADKCIDTCCANWVINVTADNKKFYEAESQEIAKEVEPYESDEFRMKSCDNGACIQLENGLCNVHKNFGETFLPDVCYTFPRAYKQVADNVYMTANLACPESLKVALYNNKDGDFSSWSPKEQSRVKPGLYDSRPVAFKDLSEDEVMNFFNMTTKMIDDPHYTCDESLARLAILAFKMEKDGEFNWADFVSQTENITETDLIAIIRNANVEETEALKSVLKAMFVLVNRDRPRYNVVVKMVRENLGDNYSKEEMLLPKFAEVKNSWHQFEKSFDQILKNLIKTQLSYALFPMGSFNNKYHSILAIILEYLVIKLALMAKCSEVKRELTQAEIIDVIQPTAKRFYVRRNQEILDFCKDDGWEDIAKTVAIILNFSA